MLPITLSIALYGAGWFAVWRRAWSGQSAPSPKARILIWLGLAAHLLGLYFYTVYPNGFNVSLFNALSLFFWTTNLIIALSNFKKPLHNLFLLTLPLTLLALLIHLYTHDTNNLNLVHLSKGVAIHILLSVLAYSVLIVATVQALLLAYQDNKIRNKHPGGLVRILPPLQTMETLLFEVLQVGHIMLTLVIVTGLFYIEDIAAQQLHHKIVFTVIAWIIYAILLWGRYARGWRGTQAIRWTLAGFACLVLAYLGSKFVLEYLLNAPISPST